MLFGLCLDIDSLLVTLKSLSSNEEDEDLRILEEMLKSNNFKKAKHVSHVFVLTSMGTSAWLAKRQTTTTYIPAANFVFVYTLALHFPLNQLWFCSCTKLSHYSVITSDHNQTTMVWFTTANQLYHISVNLGAALPTKC